AGAPHQLRRDILVVAWEKLAWNAAFNAVTTLTGATVGAALALPASRALVLATMIETDAVATGAGIPVRRERLARVLAESADQMADFATSMLQDLRRGRRLEHDALNGAVVRAAARTGVPAPLNRTLLGLLARLDPGRRQPRRESHGALPPHRARRRLRHRAAVRRRGDRIRRHHGGIGQFELPLGKRHG